MIVLTGGAGFIGSCFLKTLNNKGIYDVLVVDHLGHSAKWKNLLGKKFIKFVNKTDFRDLLKNNYYENRISAIFHFGACSSTTETDADYLIDNNYNYSIELAQYAFRNNIRFIYASSAATYGDGALGYSDLKFEEFQPLNAYGFSKQLFDLWLVQNSYMQKVVGLKFFNVFGPNEYHKNDMSSMVYKAYNQIVNTDKVQLFKSNSNNYKNGEQMRDFIYVKDACNIIWDIYLDKNINGIYNLGTGKARSWNDLANAVFSALNKNPNIEYIDMPISIVNQYQNFTQADMSKLLKTNIKLEFSELENSIKDYVQNYLSKNYLIY